MDRLTLLLINFLVFHTCWLANAFGAAHQITYLGPAFIVSGLILHFFLIDEVRREVLNITFISISGFLMDTLLFLVGVFTFHSTQIFYGLPPVWLFFQWMIFSTLFRLSLNWLKGRYWTASILGFLGGPFAYWAAAQLDALMIPNLWYGLSVMAIAWALIMPVFIWFIDRDPDHQLSLFSYGAQESVST